MTALQQVARRLRPYPINLSTGITFEGHGSLAARLSIFHPDDRYPASQQSDEGRILGGFLKNNELGLGGGQPLHL